jgi:hypothetical protein
MDRGPRQCLKIPIRLRNAFAFAEEDGARAHFDTETGHLIIEPSRVRDS